MIRNDQLVGRRLAFGPKADAENVVDLRARLVIGIGQRLSQDLVLRLFLEVFETRVEIAQDDSRRIGDSAAPGHLRHKILEMA